MKYKVRAPRWWTGSQRDEPLTIPLSTGTWLTVGGLLVGGAVVLEILLPWLLGARARAPLAILLNGALSGTLDGLLAIGLILVYRTTRVINFAQVALGSAAGGFTLVMTGIYGLPYWIVAPLALVLAGLIGVAAEILFVRRFFTAPRLVLTIATVAMAPAVTRLNAFVIGQLNPPEPGTTPQVVQSIPPRLLPFGDVRIPLPPLTFNFGHIETAVLAVVALAALAAFLRYSRLGQAVRGAAENSEAAWLLGIDIKLLSAIVWGLAAVLSGVVSLLRTTTGGFDTGDVGAVGLLIPLAAALVAGMETLWLALFFAVWLGAFEQGLFWAYPDSSYFNAGVLGVMVVALVVQRRRLQRRESRQGAAWQAVRDIRPTPTELSVLPLVRRGRAAMLLAVLAALAAFPFLATAGQLHGGGIVLIYVIIALSLMILAGWAGQVSLGHLALVATGALVGGGLISRFDVNFFIALPAGGVAAGILAVGFGLPALRLKGLYLAVITLAVAAALPQLFGDARLFGWLQPSELVARPRLGIIDLDDDRQYYYFLAALALVSVYTVTRLRRSRPGRVLIALRDNEASAQSVGISPLMTRAGAFALSGVMAGVSGVLLEVFEPSSKIYAANADLSLAAFLMIVLGGIGSVSGAVLGAVVGESLQVIVPDASQLVSGVGALVVLLVIPGGLAQVVYALRDSLYRVISLRNRLVVPSLFEDYDIEAHRRREMPLTRPSAGQGLGALPVTRRYALPSFLWHRGVERS